MTVPELRGQPFRISREGLNALPSELHRLFARRLIARGEWILVDDPPLPTGA